MASSDIARLFGINQAHLSYYRNLAHHDEATVLRMWRLVLHQAGPWNELAEAWGYRYRMDPDAGDVFPRPDLFDP